VTVAERRAPTPVILGIDAGTTSVKSVVFSTTGKILGIARTSVAVVRVMPGGAESDPEDVWLATVQTTREALANVPGADVLAIGVTGQGDGAWLLDSDDQPLRNAVLWLDGRAANRVDRWGQDGRAQAVQETTGSPLFAGALPVLLAELTEADPELMGRASIHLNCKDWLRFRLVGEKATDPSESSRTYLDTSTLAYSDHLLATLGQTGLRHLLPPVRDPYSRAGTLTAAAAQQLGLPAGLPVAVGLVDTVASAVGLGAVGDGDGYIVLGSTGTVGITHPSRREVKTDFGIVIATGRGGQVIETFSTMSGTPNLDWVRATLRLDDADWRSLEHGATSVTPGSGGVIYLPYGSPSGERAPFVDANASASWHGMSTTTTPDQLLRSVYEGLAYSLTECLNLVDLFGPVSICGGGSQSDLMCQVLADVSGRRILRPDEPEVGARGAAMIALLVAGNAADLPGAIAAMRPSSTTFEPDAERHRFYRGAFTAFLATRDAVRAQWAMLRELRS
jgi:erythritol kinase